MEPSINLDLPVIRPCWCKSVCRSICYIATGMFVWACLITGVQLTPFRFNASNHFGVEKGMNVVFG